MKKLLSFLVLSLLLTSCSALPQDEVDNGILLGEPDAPVEMVVYLDYQCPECKEFHDTVLPTLEAGYIAEGKLRLRLRDFPVVAGSNLSHNAAWCARESGTEKFRAYISALYANQDAQRIFQLKEIGTTLELPDSFATCVDQESHANIVNMLKNRGRQDKVVRTPTILLGDQRFNGMTDLFEVVAAVDAQLKLNEAASGE